MKFFYQVKKGDAILGTRTSPREYSHAVVTWADTRFDHSAWRAASVENPKAEPKDFYVPCERHVTNVEYCGRLDLAQKKATKPNQEIIALIVTEKKGRK